MTDPAKEYVPEWKRCAACPCVRPPHKLVEGKCADGCAYPVQDKYPAQDIKGKYPGEDLDALLAAYHAAAKPAPVRFKVWLNGSQTPVYRTIAELRAMGIDAISST